MNKVAQNLALNVLVGFKVKVKVNAFTWVLNDIYRPAGMGEEGWWD